MAYKPFYPLDLPDSVKSLPAQLSADSTATPQSENRVYPASDLLKLAPTSPKDKMKPLVTVIEDTEDTDTKQNTDATVQNATEVGTKITTDKVGQTTTQRKTSSADTKPKEESTAVTGGTADGEKRKKKKRKTKRTNSDRTLLPPKAKATGFEEFYCEGPIHPDVYAEEVNTVYHRQVHFPLQVT